MSDDAPSMVGKDGLPVTRGRIRPALDTAIRLIEEEGYTIADAAKAVGYRTHSLTQALHKPHVRAFRASVKHAWRQGQTAKAWLTVADLASSAMSEDVRLKAAKVFIDADEAARATMPDQARQLVQIVTQNVNIGRHLTSDQVPGVIEAKPYQPLIGNASNPDPVGHGESGDE